jgi:hypothetical protein
MKPLALSVALLAATAAQAQTWNYIAAGPMSGVENSIGPGGVDTATTLDDTVLAQVVLCPPTVGCGFGYEVLVGTLPSHLTGFVTAGPWNGENTVIGFTSSGYTGGISEILNSRDQIIGFDLSWSGTSCEAAKPCIGGVVGNGNININNLGDYATWNASSGGTTIFGSESNHTPGTWVEVPELDSSRGVAALALLIGFGLVLRDRRA